MVSFRLAASGRYPRLPAGVLARVAAVQTAGVVVSHHAPNNLRRSAAALPKMRMPSTTMIAVDS